MEAVEKTILDLNIQCLHKMLSYLENVDFVNLAEAFNITDRNIKELENSEDDTENLTKTKFTQFANILMNVFLLKNGPWIGIRDKYQFYLKLLHHFGGVIKELGVDFRYNKNDSEMEVELGMAIQKYCRESLVYLRMDSMSGAMFSNLSQPFPNVKEVRLQCGKLNANASKFNNWFPKMSKLWLLEIQFAEPECIENHFPNLVDLIISNGWEEVTSKAPESFVSISHFSIALHLNPQLKSLHLGRIECYDGKKVEWNEFLLNFIKRKLPNLYSLSFDRTSFYKFKGFEDSISIDSLTSLNLHGFCDFSKFKIKSNQLKSLTFKTDKLNSNTFDAVIKYLNSNSTIESLTLYAMRDCYELHSEEMINTINALPNLKTLAIMEEWKDNVTIDSIVQLLSSCKQITKLQVFCDFESILRYSNQTNIKESVEKFARDHAFDANPWNIAYFREFNKRTKSHVLFKKGGIKRDPRFYNIYTEGFLPLYN